MLIVSDVGGVMIMTTEIKVDADQFAASALITDPEFQYPGFH